MKVIKRDGRAVDYDREKIVIAIEKANKEVRNANKATEEEIKEIIHYIEELDKKRMLVEDIQDVIEEKLMEHGRYELAKKYIVYRYTRALVRKQNTTDESILGLIKNQNQEQSNEYSNKILQTASMQRNYIAGVVSKDLTKRILLPEKISKANEEGVLYFHDADYFLQPMFNSCLINIEDMLDNGTVINGKLIESPKSFRVACTVLTQIIAVVASNQYGGQSVDLKYLGKYLRKSKEKFQKEIQSKYLNKMPKDVIDELIQENLKRELSAGVQNIQYQINTLITTNGHSPYVTLLLNLEENDEYIEENAMIIEEILKQQELGLKNEEGTYVTPDFPKLIYVLYDHNCLKGGKYDNITKLAIKCSSKNLSPDYISSKKMKQNYEGNIFSPTGEGNFLTPWKDENGKYKFNGRFNQGVVTINLPQIGIIADGNEEEFWKLLDDRLEICYEALMCRHYALLGTKADTSPIHWKYGAIARLKTNETIDEFLKNGYSTLSLGYIGIYEVTKLVKNVSNITKQGEEFALKIIKHLKQATERWKKETGIVFSLYGIESQKTGHMFAKIDKEKFGTIKDITDKGYYTNSYHANTIETIDEFEKLKLESKLQSISSGGGVSFIKVSKEEKMEEIIKFIYENIQYAKFF